MSRTTVVIEDGSNGEEHAGVQNIRVVLCVIHTLSRPLSVSFTSIHSEVSYTSKQQQTEAQLMFKMKGEKKKQGKEASYCVLPDPRQRKKKTFLSRSFGQSELAH